MDKIIEHTLLSIAGLGLAYFAYWAYKDIKRENRPPVTDDMIDQAYIDMLDNSEFYYIDGD
jgi:hypothetical protein